MANLTDLTTSQLNSIIVIKEQIEELQGPIDSIAGGGKVPTPFTLKAPTPARRKYHMTAAHRRKLIKALAKARRIRLAKIKGKAKPDANTRTLPPSPSLRRDKPPRQVPGGEVAGFHIAPCLPPQHGIHRHHHQGVGGSSYGVERISRNEQRRKQKATPIKARAINLCPCPPLR